MMCLFLLVDLVELSTFSGFSCMQSSGLKISRASLWMDTPFIRLVSVGAAGPRSWGRLRGWEEAAEEKGLLAPHSQQTRAAEACWSALLRSTAFICSHCSKPAPKTAWDVWRATGMPEGTYLYNCIKDHFVFYEILSRGFVF